MQDSDPHNRVILKVKQMLIDQFENVKIYLNEKSAKLIMINKIEERAMKKEEIM